MDYQLVVLRGRSTRQVVKLSDGVTAVGRHQGCNLRIASSQVSRRHCELFEKKGLLMVKDLGSSNGTFVNGKKIEGQRVLEPGDVLSFGKVRFRVERIGQPLPSGSDDALQKPSDTAVAAGAMAPNPGDEGDSEEFEIDFDDDTETPSAGDLDIPLEAGAPPGTAEAQAAAPAAEPEPVKEGEPKAPELGEDAVADFLMSMQLDEEDKR
jgi:pSer/pThr/pTyr-binding forkhead associated (FHA) protein